MHLFRNIMQSTGPFHWPNSFTLRIFTMNLRCLENKISKLKIFLQNERRANTITINQDTVTAQCIHLTRLLSLDLSLLSSSLSLLPLLLSRPLSLCFSLSTSWTLSLSRRFSLSLFTSFSLSLLEDFLWGLSLPLLLRWRFLEVSRGSSLLSLLSEVNLLAV